MNRKHYITYRNRENHFAILYRYYRDNGGTMAMAAFEAVINAYVAKKQPHLMQEILQHYDQKFTVIKLQGVTGQIIYVY